MRHLFLAAFAAATMNSAQADDGVSPVRPDEPCVGCGHKPKAPAPVTPAPAPVPEPEVVTPPTPAPAPGVIEVILPPAPVPEQSHDGNDRFRIGGSLGVRGGLWTVPAGSIAESVHTALPAGEVGPGAYVGYQTSTEPGGVYIGIDANYGVGSIRSASWSGGLTVGAVAAPGVILGLRVGGLNRDLAVSGGQYNSRFIGGGGGFIAILDLMPKDDGVLDISLVPDVRVDFGSARNPVTGGVLMPATDVTGGLTIRIGIRSK